MHPPTPTLARFEDQPSSSSSSRAAPLSQYPTRTASSTAYVAIPSLPYKNPQTTATLFPTPQLPCHCDFETERQRHLRQNQDIIRLLSLKSIQIRRSEAEISQLERTNLELTVALHRAQRDLQEKSTVNTASLHRFAYSPATTNLREEWIQLGQTQQAIPYLQQHIESGLPPHHQQPSRDYYDCGRDYTDDADLILSLTPRSKRRKLESLVVSSATPRNLAMIKLEHIRAIYQHEQKALIEVMQSHRSTTELYKETLRILSVDRECSSSHFHTGISGRSHASQPDQRLDQSQDSSRYFTDAMLLPPGRSAQSSTALVMTPPNLKRARAQQTPSPLPFFNMDTGTGGADSDLTNLTLDPSRQPFAEPAQVRCEQAFKSRSTSSDAEGTGSESQQTIFDASTEPAPKVSNNPRESARRPKRTVSRVGAGDLSNISEQFEHTIHDIADAVMSEPSRSVSSLDLSLPAPRQSIDPQDLIIGNQKPRPTPAIPRAPKRQLMTSPYSRQEASPTAKVSPSAAARRDRYILELAKAKAQSKKLVAMFRNKSTGSKASSVLETSLEAKSEDTTATAELGLDSHANEKPSSTEADSITSTMATPSTYPKTAVALDRSATRSPRIPRAIKKQHRLGGARSLASHRSGIHPDKLKSLTAGQLLRRMNKTLLGSSRLPVLPRTIVQKGVSSSAHLALLRPAAKGLSSTVSAVTIKPSTSISTPNMTSSSSDTTPPSTAATETIAEAAANQAIPPPVTAMTKAKTATKSSATVAVKSLRVTRSVLTDKFRRVTRSTAASASQML